MTKLYDVIKNGCVVSDGLYFLEFGTLAYYIVLFNNLIKNYIQ